LSGKSGSEVNGVKLWRAYKEAREDEVE